jgi:hypothetical protein
LKEVLEQTREECMFATLLPAGEEEDPLDRISQPRTSLTSRIPTNIQGSESFKAKQRALFEEFKDVFDEELSQDPVKVPPLDINVDTTKWHTNKNRRGPRPQSVAKQHEIDTQINKMLDKGIIEPSKASHWSQVLLTPKPNGKFRFCVDLRELNSSTEPGHSWPIPNIHDMLDRLAARKPRYYGKFDLTMGYFQMGLGETSRAFISFITYKGLYQFKRIPMGMKSAGHYFQQMMATRVLSNLLYQILELYIDDLLCYADTEEQYLANLRTILERLREFNVKVHPDKVISGVEEVEFVGRVLSREGVKMSQERIEEIQAFPKPENLTLLRSFLGLANYFRDHIRNHSETVQPLQDMILMATTGRTKSTPKTQTAGLITIPKVDKKAKVIWTPQAETAFSEIKHKITECPTLYFTDPNGKVYLQTDASDYGYGAYLFQITKEGEERPTRFISKSFSRDQVRWSTPEKEMYAIYYALKTWEHLLRDIRFTLRTDHLNLLAKESENAKVTRWKILIQEYDYEIEHISGVNNSVADAFSRLCNKHEETSITPESILAADETPHKIEEEAYQILKRIHNTNVGHRGVEATLVRVDNILHEIDRIKTEPEKLTKFLKDLRYEGDSNKLLTFLSTWRHKRKDIKAFIRRCPCCQKMSRIQTPIHTAKFTLSTTDAPMLRLNVDFLGPFPTDTEGNTYILVIIDMFSRFVELYAVRDSKSETFANALLKHIGRYGAPDTLWSDNGPSFIAHIIQQLLDIVGTEHHLTLAYSHEENAIVERANKEVVRHLRDIVMSIKLKKDWSNILPLVQRMMNSEVHSALGISPAQLLFGNQIMLNRGFLLPYPTTPVLHSEVTQIQTNNRRKSDSKKIKTLQDYAANLIRIQTDLAMIAQRNQNKLNLFNITRRRTNEPDTVFPVNSYVFIEYQPVMNTGRRQAPTKLHAPLKGPYKVLASEFAKYTLLNLVTGNTEVAHIKTLRAFEFDPTMIDPREVAKADHLEYTVENIIRHDGEFTDKKATTKYKNIAFLVKWEGFDDDRNSWVEWKDLRMNPTMHQYLRSIGQERHIPVVHDDDL